MDATALGVMCSAVGDDGCDPDPDPDERDLRMYGRGAGLAGSVGEEGVDRTGEERVGGSSPIARSSVM